MQKQLQAVVLPDPLAKAAMKAGAGLVVDDSIYPNYSSSVLSFSLESIGQKSKTVQKFLQAWDQATGDLNTDPEKYRPILLKKIRVPGNIRNTFRIPRYPRSSVPNKEQWLDVMNWMVEKGLLKTSLAYSGSITGDFLP